MDRWDDSLFPDNEPVHPDPIWSWWLNRNFGGFRHFTETISNVSVCTVKVFMDYRDVDGFLGDLTEYMKQYKAKKIQQHKEWEKTEQYKKKPKKTHRKRRTMKALPAPKLDASEGDNYPSGLEEVYEEKEASEEQTNSEELANRNTEIVNPMRICTVGGMQEPESFGHESTIESKELPQQKTDSEDSYDREKKTECQGLAQETKESSDDEKGSEVGKSRSCGEKRKFEEEKEGEESQQNKWNSEKCCVKLESGCGEMFIGGKRKGHVLDGIKRKRLETMAYSS